jgi:hypothetical protein
MMATPFCLLIFDDNAFVPVRMEYVRGRAACESRDRAIRLDGQRDEKLPALKVIQKDGP